VTGLDEGSPRSAALEYASRGWPVFPCHSVGPRGCSCCQRDCSSPGKHPRIARGLHAASTDPGEIARWWHRWPSANVAVRTGSESGLVVIDIDPQHGGAETMRALIASHAPLPRGPVVRTGSGGWHLLFAHPGEPVRNSAGTRLGTGVDVRGDAGYAIAPPSRHASGNSYRWNTRTDELPRLPGWLFGLMRAPERARSSVMRGPIRLDEALSAWARAALDGEADRVRSAPNGSRNSTLNRSAFSLGQIVGAGVLHATTVEQVLGDSALASGLGEREAFLTIRSGLRAGLDHPRGPSGRSYARPSAPTRERATDVGIDAADLL
jgi:hypothetical protein